MDREDREHMLKIVAVVVCVIGVIALMFMVYSDKKERARDQQAATADEKREMSAYGMAKTEYQTKCMEWKKKIKAKSYGNLDVVLTVDSIDRSIYDYVFQEMMQVDYCGTLVLYDGIAPGDRPEDMTREEFDVMRSSGWNYAFGLTISAKDDLTGWKEALDRAVSQWDGKGIEQPSVFVCREDQYAEGMDESLKKYNITALVVVKDKKIGLAETYKSDWNELDSIMLKENYSNVTTMMKEALANGRSMGITFGKVLEIPEDKNQELSQKKFGQFISQLQDMEKNGAKIVNYQEYAADRQASNTELAQLKEEYQQYKTEQKAHLEKLKKEGKDK